MFCFKKFTKDNIYFQVVSIFGNSGDGKSHTLNNVFFGGQEIFKTSSEQVSHPLRNKITFKL